VPGPETNAGAARVTAASRTPPDAGEVAGGRVAPGRVLRERSGEDVVDGFR